MNEWREKQEKTGSEIAVIGVGDFGCEVVGNIRFKDLYRPLLVRVNWEDCLPELADDFVHCALESKYRGFTKGDPVAAAKTMAVTAPDLIQLTLSASFIVLISQPGDGVSSGAVTALADAFQRSKVPFLTILALPDSETVGRKRHMTARSTISELCVMKETPVIFDQVDFPGYYEAFKKAVMDKIQTLMDALSPGMIPIDFNRIRTALTGSANSTVATARATGHHRAHEVVESVLADYAVEPFLNRKASILMHLQSDEALSLYEVEEVAHLISDSWGDDIDLIYGVDHGGCKPGELRLGLIVGEYVDDLDLDYGLTRESDDVDEALKQLMPRLQSGIAR